MNDPGQEWTDAQLDLIAPDEPSIRHAKTFVCGWSTGDRKLMDLAITESHTAGTQLKLLGALAEWLTQGLNLRNDPAARDALRTEIARHVARENDTGTTPPKGDQK